jgi:lysophospholipase L1-like esterase
MTKSHFFAQGSHLVNLDGTLFLFFSLKMLNLKNMSKKVKSLICFLLATFILLVAYIYLANAFIYYRIGSGGLSNPIIKEKYMINNNLPTASSTLYVSLGDSLTAGAGTIHNNESYPYVLAEKMAGQDKKIILKNFSYPGAKSQDLIDNLLEPAIIAQPDVITLLIGVNDIHNRVSEEQFKKNYTYILERLSKETKAKIYVINIPFIGSNTIILPPLNRYFDEQTQKYNRIIEGLTKSYQVKYIDLYSISWYLLRKDGPLYSSDSFHPSAAGYAWWAQIIYDNFDK